MKKMAICIWTIWGILGLLLAPCTCAAANSGIINTKHNLSVTGPGEVHALTETRICVFCHTPHNATPNTPLWNREITQGVNYQTYSSTTFNVNLSQPSGSSRLCLSCHDGTIALGAVKSVTGGITMNMELTGRPTLLGTDLRDDHPFSFSYAEGLAKDPELAPTPPTDLTFYSGDVIQCTTCHDPHDDTYGMFLAVDNTNAALCTKCHQKTGWTSCAHATASNTWNGVGNNPWPINSQLGTHARTTVAQNGCENCHTPHNAGGPQRLLRYRKEEKNCILACHNGNLGAKNVAAEFSKPSHHPVEMAAIGDLTGTPHDPTEDVSHLTGHVECQDCHNPHMANKLVTATAPNVSSVLQGVKGISKLGSVVSPASYEYEICLKCHGDSSSLSPVINRYTNETTNRRLDMATTNPSYHPVFGIGKNPNVPSLPSAISPDQGLNASSIIYCTDCHADDDTSKLGGAGPKGPHGSIYSPLLRERYDTLDGTSESAAAYALCYRCHDRTSILSDVSFQHKGGGGGGGMNHGGHSGHLAAGATCSTCHDPHGVEDDGVSGSHTHLINFNSAVVSPYPGNSTPIFTDLGTFHGSCTLVCHGRTHNGSMMYTYP